MARKGSGDDDKRREAKRRRPDRGTVIRGVFEGAPAPVDELELPAPPIPLDDAGRKCWRHHTAILVRDPRFDPERDLEILAAFCLVWSRIQAAEKMIDDEGLLAATADGSVKKHPAVTVATENLTLLKQYANELGLSPISRKRLPESKSPPAPGAGGETRGDKGRRLLD